VEIIEETSDRIKVYRLEGRLDANSAEGLEEKLFQAISEGTNRIIIDFENLDYLSSGGLRVIFKANKVLTRKDGQLILCSMQKFVRDIFKVTGIDSFVPIVDTLDDALKVF
jgi:anti-sigma B factor antagonist